MISSMLMFEVLIWVFFAHFCDTMPAWLVIFCMTIWFIAHVISYASEDLLRGKVKKLENEVEKLKKGGE